MSIVGDRMLAFTKKYTPDIAPALQGTGIYLSTAVVQGSIESGYGTSSAAKNKNNFFGLGGSRLFKFSTPKECFSYYAKLFNSQPEYIAKNVVNQDSPYTQLRAIADSGYYSMTNDETLARNWKGNGGVPKGWVWNGYTWNGQKWVGSNFTNQQSADHYYNTLKPVLAEYLRRVPFAGKIESKTDIALAQNKVSQSV
jgi:hypothetical protein